LPNSDLIDIQVSPVPILTLQSRQSLQKIDVLIVPGGQPGAMSTRMTKKGQKNLKHFIESGGGYVGICAGAVIASQMSVVPLLCINDTQQWNHTHLACIVVYQRYIVVQFRIIWRCLSTVLP